MKSKYLIFAGIGVELVGIMIACLLLGQWLDRQYDLKGLAMVGLSVMGLAGWLVQIVKLTQKFDQQADD